MKKLLCRCAVLCAVAALLLCVVGAACAATPFDPDVIAESVLRLMIFDANGDLIASGSGFVMFDRSTLVTNYHVIEDAAQIIADNDDGSEYFLTKVLICSEEKDIAILRFASASDRTPLEYSTDSLKRGSDVWTIGYPLGYSPYTLTTGIISSIFTDDGADYVQYDAAITNGNSGGALVNDQGKVIGITTAGFVGGENMNVAVRIHEVLDLYKKWDGVTTYPMRQYKSAVYGHVSTATPKPATPTPTPRPVTPTPRPVVTATPYTSSLKLNDTCTVKNGKVTISWSDPSNSYPYKVTWQQVYNGKA